MTQLDAIRGLHTAFTRAGVPYWLFGGWAVDFHVGRITRPHADIDIAVLQSDAADAERVLVAAGWTHAPPPGAEGYTTYELSGVDVDVAFVPADRDGWPADSFQQDLRILEGVTAQVVSRSSLVADKSVVRDEPTTRQKDRLDVVALTASA